MGTPGYDSIKLILSSGSSNGGLLFLSRPVGSLAAEVLGSRRVSMELCLEARARPSGFLLEASLTLPLQDHDLHHRNGKSGLC